MGKFILAKYFYTFNYKILAESLRKNIRGKLKFNNDQDFDTVLD